MDLDIRIRHGAAEDVPGLRAHLSALLERSLRRMGRRLAWVVVHLDDVNGPKGGTDKRCIVRVQPDGGAVAVAEVRGTDPLAAADQGLRRALRRLKSVVLRGRRR